MSTPLFEMQSTQRRHPPPPPPPPNWIYSLRPPYSGVVCLGQSSGIENRVQNNFDSKSDFLFALKVVRFERVVQLSSFSTNCDSRGNRICENIFLSNICPICPDTCVLTAVLLVSPSWTRCLPPTKAPVIFSSSERIKKEDCAQREMTALHSGEEHKTHFRDIAYFSLRGWRFQSIHGRHFVLVADGRLRANDKIMV